MAIYVDQAIFPYRGQLYCHMATDGDIEELHKMAAAIGMKRSWFQNKRGHPHYDLGPKMRAAAVASGAKELSCRDLVKICFLSRVDVTQRS